FNAQTVKKLSVAPRLQHPVPVQHVSQLQRSSQHPIEWLRTLPEAILKGLSAIQSASVILIPIVKITDDQLLWAEQCSPLPQQMSNHLAMIDNGDSQKPSRVLRDEIEVTVLPYLIVEGKSYQA